VTQRQTEVRLTYAVTLTHLVPQWSGPALALLARAAFHYCKGAPVDEALMGGTVAAVDSFDSLRRPPDNPRAGPISTDSQEERGQ